MNRSPFLNHIREYMFKRNYAKRTIETYLFWIRRYILFHGRKHPEVMGDVEVVAFLDHLVLKREVAVGTQAVVLNTLNFLYKHILQKPLSEDLAFVRSRRPRKLPVVLTRDEVTLLLSHLGSAHYLPAALMYGSGLRIIETVRLRVKDIDFDYSCIRVWNGKGGKHRTVTLASGTDIRTVQDQLGHIDVKTTQIYTHVLQMGANAVPSPFSGLKR